VSAIVEWIPAQPVVEWIDEAGLLGQLPGDAPPPAVPPNGNGTKKSLSVIEKVVIAGFVLNAVAFAWNVWRATKTV